MNYPRILTMQDISCVGQCSLTVALPVISACGAETCVLPSAVLSTHTAGFTGYTFRDLTDDIAGILRHWERENIKFDAVYTGYLGSARQIDYALEAARTLLRPHGVLIVDPAMADNGKMYPAFDLAFAAEMKKLVAAADYALPNITEACFITGREYKTVYDADYINGLADAVLNTGARNVVLTGVSYDDSTTGVLTKGKEGEKYYRHEKIGNGCHGTGDIYASAFTGALLKGAGAVRAASIAADFVVRCIKATAADKDHFYGAEFEPQLGWLIKEVQTACDDKQIC